MMQHWLQARGQQMPTRAPSTCTGHGDAGAMPMMPGMLTPDEMERLAAAKGTEFDRLFLEGMIKHHGGAMTMVKELFATPGAGQTRRFSRSRRTSTPISGWKSTAWTPC